MSKSSNKTGRQLLILRHGKSDWDADVSDFLRPLKKRGVDAAQKIGQWLLEQGLVPDTIISSPANRAYSTASEVADILGINEIQEDEGIYGANLSKLLDILSGIPEESERVMIVGHNPGLESLLVHLAEVPEHHHKDWKLLTTGTVAILNMPDDWDQLDEECAQLVDLIRGRDL